MKIEVGQIWRRIPTMTDFFPIKGWKVEITKIHRGTITHKLVEYNGEPREDKLTTSHFLDDFLSMYELDE
jgi:hypothetical protein